MCALLSIPCHSHCLCSTSPVHSHSHRPSSPPPHHHHYHHCVLLLDCVTISSLRSHHLWVRSWLSCCWITKCASLWAQHQIACKISSDMPNWPDKGKTAISKKLQTCVGRLLIHAQSLLGQIWNLMNGGRSHHPHSGGLALNCPLLLWSCLSIILWSAMQCLGLALGHQERVVKHKCAVSSFLQNISRAAVCIVVVECGG